MIKKLITGVLFCGLSLFAVCQSQTTWMEPKKCMKNAQETPCVIKINGCYLRVFMGSEKLFYIEQKPGNILLWRRKFVRNTSLLKCK